MSSEAMQVVLQLFPPGFREGKLDMCELIDQDPFWTLITELFEPEAEVRFLTPEAGLMGGMAGPFRGPAGFRAGWREWIKPYDSFRVEVENAQTTPDDRVVLLVQTFATLQGSSAEVEQPSAVVYTVRGGRIARADHYLGHEQALHDAGLA